MFADTKIVEGQAAFQGEACPSTWRGGIGVIFNYFTGFIIPQ